MTDIESEAKKLCAVLLKYYCPDDLERCEAFLRTLLSRHADAVAAQYIEALKLAHHELTTQNGLWASDESDPIMITGDVVWQLDNGAVMRAIDKALSTPQSSRAEAMLNVVGDARRVLPKQSDKERFVALCVLSSSIAAYDALGEGEK